MYNTGKYRYWIIPWIVQLTPEYKTPLNVEMSCGITVQGRVYYGNLINVYRKKKLIEISRECHNHKPQPTPDTKRKRNMTKTNTYKTNKQLQEKHRQARSSPSEVITMLKEMTKHEDKEHGKTLNHEASRSINHKAPQNKDNIVLLFNFVFCLS